MIAQYAERVKREVDSSISKIPKGDGTVEGLTKRIGRFKKLLEELDHKLRDLGNEFLNINGDSAGNIEQVKTINIEEVKRFIASMKN